MAGISRRALLGTAGGLVAVGLIKTQADAVNVLARLDAQAPDPQDPTQVMGRVPTEVGERAASERPQRYVNRALPSGESMTVPKTAADAT